MNPSSDVQAGVLVDELLALGVTEAVLCPGSRNAPLSYALHGADAEGRVRLHVRIDERTAGFLALGLALRSGRPVPVACTSGTAAANLHPAVLEASHAGVPLLVLTADRPPELIGTGASQTIEQPGLYGAAARLSVELVVAGRPGGEPSVWRCAVRAAVAAALGRGGGRGSGPVQLNIPFAEPLVPGPGGPAGPNAVPPAGATGAVAREGAEPSTALPLDPRRPTLVIGGSVPVGAPPLVIPKAVPVIAEPSSPLWPTALRAGPWLLGRPAGPPSPRQVLLHGRPTLHRGVTRLLADPAVEVYAVAGTCVAGRPAAVRGVGAPPELDPRLDWCRRWARADAAAGAALDAQLAGCGQVPVGLRLAAALVAALPDGALLTLGSSNAVRDVALAARPRTGLTVLANRGVAGIDGTVSSAVGAALAHRSDGGGPGYALLGDLTLLHDVTGLMLGPDEPRPDLTIVVLNDVGGGIFSLLEQGAPEHADGFERVFGTPHRVRLAELCAGLGVGHRLVTDLRELPAALAPGVDIRVVEVPAERTGLRAGHEALRAAVQKAVEHALGRAR